MNEHIIGHTTLSGDIYSNKHIFNDNDINEKSSENMSQETNKKLDILYFNNGWNDNNETLIVNIGENAAAFKYMHEKSCNKYLLFDKSLKIGLAILSVIISADSFINFFHSEIFDILIKIVSFILTIISIIYNFIDYAEISTKHSHSSSEFGLLYHDIRNIMCLYRRDRPNAVKYIQHCMKHYDHLEINGPSIPKYILKKSKKIFYNIDISIPDITKKIQKIDIVTEPNSTFNINNQSNLDKISNTFKINGDLSENDNITSSQLYSYKNNANKQNEYEMNRFIAHN